MHDITLSKGDTPDRGLTRPSSISEMIENFPLNRRHWFVFAVCAAGFIFDSFDFQILAMTAPSIAKEWGLSSSTLGLVFSSIVAGMLIGSLVFGVVADRIGRRGAFQLTVGIFGVFAGLSAFTQDVYQLAAAQFLVGVGIGGFVPVDASVISEFMPTRHRGRMISLWALFYPVGGLCAAGAAALLISRFGWRSLFFVGAVPALLVFLLRRLIPETPRYLLRIGRLNEARACVTWLSGGKYVPTVEEMASDAKIPMQARKHASISDLLRGPLRAKTLMIWAVWFSWSFSYFGILLWLPTLLTKYKGLPGDRVFFFMIGFMLSGIAGRIVVSLVIDKVGRVPVIALFGVCASALFVVFGLQNVGVWLYVAGYAFAFFHDGGLSAIASYTPELYPTPSRATGYGFAAGVGRIASMISPALVGVIVDKSIMAVFIMLGAGYLLAACSSLMFGPETNGQALEEAPASEAVDLRLEQVRAA